MTPWGKFAVACAVGLGAVACSFAASTMEAYHEFGDALMFDIAGLVITIIGGCWAVGAFDKRSPKSESEED